jgi:hypothetical protein
MPGGVHALEVLTLTNTAIGSQTFGFRRQQNLHTHLGRVFQRRALRP